MLKRNIYNQPTIMLMLILFSMAVLLHQTTHNYIQNSLILQSKVLEKSTNSDKNDSTKVKILTQDVFLSISVIQINQLYYQINEIIFGKENKKKNRYVITKYVYSFLKNLFEQVISPNAP